MLCYVKFSVPPSLPEWIRKQLMRLSILTPAQQSAVSRKRDGQTRAEIALSRGVTPQAVKKLWSRARKRLRSTMTPEELAIFDVCCTPMPQHIKPEQLRGSNC